MPLLPRRDLATTVPMAALVAVYLLFLADSTFLAARGMTALTLILTGATVLLLADDHPGRTTWLTPLLAAASVVCAALSFTRAPTMLLTISIATTLTLWTLQLAGRLTFEPPQGNL